MKKHYFLVVSETQILTTLRVPLMLAFVIALYPRVFFSTCNAVQSL
jgi:hypothetical protein